MRGNFCSLDNTLDGIGPRRKCEVNPTKPSGCYMYNLHSYIGTLHSSLGVAYNSQKKQRSFP
jgi:hypothetical protein